MPGPGGDSDKRGNQFEAVWTVEAALDVFTGRFQAIIAEPADDKSTGVEFYLEKLDNTYQFHSVKRQKQRGDWSVADLCRAHKATGRSILGDLFSKRSQYPDADTRFVSSTGANELRELAERAEPPSDVAAFRRALSAKLQAEFDKRIVSLCGGDPEAALCALKSIEVITRGHKDLVRIVERRIDELFYRKDRSRLRPADVRRMIADFVNDNLQSRIDGDRLRKLIGDNGIGLRDWKTDETVADAVAAANRRYLSVTEAELVNSGHIVRDVVGHLIDALSDAQSRGALLIAPGGFGKSCVLAQCVSRLLKGGTRYLCLRMDSLQPCATPRQLGQQLDLPASPAVVLAALADNAPSVLVVDQLDAMSLLSGRNPGMWEVFRELCEEVRAYPHMKMVLACRDFDLHHDYRLRKLGDSGSGFAKCELVKLTEAEIRMALEAAGHGGLKPDHRQLEILGVPFHLLLFLQGDPARTFTSIGELYDRYWDRKRQNLNERLGRDCRWNEVVDALTKEMSERQSLFARTAVADTWSEDAKAMASEHVLIQAQSQRQYRFFHESFFDYAYARRFCATSGGLLQFLESSEQHLFRRAQVRQVLAYRRENDFRQYTADIRDVIKSPRVRFHIKRMVALEFSRLDEPRSEEWSVIAPHLLDGDLSGCLAPALRDHVGWFDLMDSLQVIQSWLASEDPALNNAAIWYLESPKLQDSRSVRIAEIISPYVDKGDPDWQRRLLRIMSWGKPHKSAQMAAIYLGLIARGAYDGGAGSVASGCDFWSQHHDAAENSPRFVIDVLATWFDRVVEQVDDGKSWNMFDKSDQNRSHTGALYVGQAATKEPEYFVERMLPRVAATVVRTTCSRGGEVRNRAWPSLTNHSDPFTIDEAVLLNLRNALQLVALHHVQLFRSHAATITSLPHQTFGYLLLGSWTANPQECADDCASYLIADQRRFNIGYGSWVGNGEGTAESAISRLALRAISPYCSKDLFERLESGIIGYCDEVEKQNPRSRGYAELLVLRSLDNTRISRTTALRIEELERKFPKLPDAIVKETRTAMSVVSSPIAAQTADLMNDDQWIAAMEKYDGSTDPFKGGPHQLATVLAICARKDRARFAALTVRIPDAVNSTYFSAILNGLCGRCPNLSREDQEVDKKQIDGTSIELFVSVIDRLHSLPGRPCGSAIANCVKELASRQLPTRLLEIISYYANDDPDPNVEMWQVNVRGSYYHGGDPHAHGINTVRGEAAEAIGTLLFEDHFRLDGLRSTLSQLSVDPIVSVRTCAIDAFLPLLNFDRDLGVELFLRASAGCDALCATRPFNRFVEYAKYTHYTQLRDLLHFALNSDNEKAVANAAKQITRAELGEVDAGHDASKVRAGSETMRRAAVREYARNLSHKAHGNKCAERLEKFFDDESQAVRTEVSAAFFHMPGPRLLELNGFIGRFVESRSFEQDTDRLLYALKESRAELPGIVCRAAERTLDFAGAGGAHIGHSLSALVVRQYEQTTDNAIRTHCLDLIDRMEKMGYLGIDEELGRIDR